jgi:hypothetical protein
MEQLVITGIIAGVLLSILFLVIALFWIFGGEVTKNALREEFRSILK